MAVRMDCCSTSSNKEMKGGILDKDKSGSFKMDKKVILWIIIAILVVAVIYITFFRGGSTGSAVNVVQSAGQVASSGMVGGC